MTAVLWPPRTGTAGFAGVYERHHQALYRYCRSILRHDQDAQDALQSTMTRAYAALQAQPREFDLRPWLFRIAHNEAVSILRRRRPTVELDEALSAGGSLEDRVDAREALRTLRRDLDDLPERQRAALLLRELCGLGLPEIAVVLDTTPAAVKQAIFEARGALSKCHEGRAMACVEVQRMLSDGDGRVLRGRGVRAHVRSCSQCRRFRDDLGRRPAALAALAPPLPGGIGAALVGMLQASAGGGGASIAAKVAVGVVLATGSVTAVEHATGRQPVRHAVAAPPGTVAPPVVQPVVTRAAAAVVVNVPRHAAVRPTARVRHVAAAPRPAHPAVRHRHAPAPVVHAMAPALSVAPGQAKKAERNVAPPEQVKKEESKAPPGQTSTPESKAPPGQASKPERRFPPGQAKTTDGAAVSAPTVAPGLAKKDDGSLAPGQAKKDK